LQKARAVVLVEGESDRIAAAFVGALDLVRVPAPLNGVLARVTR
jgi:hypothetical protein